MLSTTEAYGLNFLFPSGDDAVGAALRDHGEFARAEVDLIADHLTAAGGAGTFIDVGANLGAIALPLAKRFPACRVIALEAHRGLAAVLAANAYSNGLFNVEPTHAAAGAARGLADFPSYRLSASGNFGALSFGMAGPGAEPVRMCPLDEVAPPDTCFVKIDVEGFEAEVLKGAANLIARQTAAWLIEAQQERRGQAAANAALMRAAGYRLFWFYAPFVSADPARGGPPARRRGDFNLLALPPQMDNLWELPPVSDDLEPWPDHVDDHPYLRRYGAVAAGEELSAPPGR